jgi:hypothetical protein
MIEERPRQKPLSPTIDKVWASFFNEITPHLVPF